MELTIKQLTQHGQVFIPQTTAEAVLVNNNGEIITLDSVLKNKIEQIITPANSGLNAYKQGQNVILTHSNSITANESPSAVKILYDSRGHIVQTSPTDTMRVTVDNNNYLEYNGQEEKNLMLGSDFGIDENNNIILKWNHL